LNRVADALFIHVYAYVTVSPLILNPGARYWISIFDNRETFGDPFWNWMTLSQGATGDIAARGSQLLDRLESGLDE